MRIAAQGSLYIPPVTEIDDDVSNWIAGVTFLIVCAPAVIAWLVM